MTKAMLWKRWAIGIAAVVCTALPAYYLLSPFGEWLPRWFRYSAIGLLWFFWMIGMMLTKHYAKKIRRCPPDFVPPEPPYDLPKPLPLEKKDLSA